MIYIHKQNKIIFYRLLSLFVAFTFAFSLVVPPVQAQTVAGLPAVGMMISTTPIFTPAIVKGIKIFPDNPLRFDFIVDTGDSGLEGDDLKEESEKLIKYFLASLTTPEEDMWVNLSPYEKDRIIPSLFGQTEMGRDLLAQDYILKQLTASLMYPEDELGEVFWKQIFKKAYEQYGTTEIPINTFNKVWIMPEKAVVYENEDTAFVVESRLKVMLEEDYLAMKKNQRSPLYQRGARGDLQREQNNNFQTDIIREILIPAIEKEVNEGKHFAQLRQIYHALILATWFKMNLKDSLLGQIYVDQNKVAGIDVEDKQIKDKIYQQYLEAFKKGAYDYIREDFDPGSQQIIPRKYFSGGWFTKGIRKVISERFDFEHEASGSPVFNVNMGMKREFSLRDGSSPIEEIVSDTESFPAKILLKKFSETVKTVFKTKIENNKYNKIKEIDISLKELERGDVGSFYIPYYKYSNGDLNPQEEELSEWKVINYLSPRKRSLKEAMEEPSLYHKNMNEVNSGKKQFIDMVRYSKSPAAEYEDIAKELLFEFSANDAEVSGYTHGAIVALEQLDLQGKTVLDLGVGDGILSIVAAKLGAKKVIAVDELKGALKLTNLNARNNQVEDVITVLNKAVVPSNHAEELDLRILEQVDVIVMNVPIGMRNTFLDNLFAKVQQLPKLEAMILSGGVLELNINNKYGLLSKKSKDGISRAEGFNQFNLGVTTRVRIRNKINSLILVTYILQKKKSLKGAASPITTQLLQAASNSKNKLIASPLATQLGIAETTKGGIDFNPNNLNIETQGQGINYNAPIDPQLLESLTSSPIEGFSPVIFNITPIFNLPMVLGLLDKNNPCLPDDEKCPSKVTIATKPEEAIL